MKILSISLSLQALWVYLFIFYSEHGKKTYICLIRADFVYGTVLVCFTKMVITLCSDLRFQWKFYRFLRLFKLYESMYSLFNSEHSKKSYICLIRADFVYGTVLAHFGKMVRTLCSLLYFLRNLYENVRLFKLYLVVF